MIRDDDLGMLANLWTDLLVNARIAILQAGAMPAEAQPPAIVRLLTVTSRSGFDSTDRLWWMYRRVYELLWNLPPETMCPTSPPPVIRQPPSEAVEATIESVPERFRQKEVALQAARRETQRIADELGATVTTRPALDADRVARLVRTFAGDAVSGALRFGMIAAPYLVELEQRSDANTGRGAPGKAGATGGAGCAGDTAPATATELGALPGTGAASEAGLDPAGGGQRLGVAQTLKLYASSNPDAVLAAWYRAEASAWVRPLTERRPSQPISELPGPLELWEIGDDLADIDWASTLRNGPQIVPGVTTQRRSYLDDEVAPAEAAIELDLYLDASGSMPHPRTGSAAVLSGTILALSTLRGGGRVRVTTFSGPGQVAGTNGFIRDHGALIAALAFFPGGGTSFPLDIFGARYERVAIADETVRRHLVVLSDDGLTSMFGEQNVPYAGVASAVRPKLTTATLVLQDRSKRVAPLAAAAGYDVSYVDSMADCPRVCARLAEVIHG